jgi:hypothetical protein
LFSCIRDLQNFRRRRFARAGGVLHVSSKVRGQEIAMTPQERKLLDELFDRLASLENAPRDPDAVAAINDGLDRAPNALYPLVQSVLVQDEALKRADARIRELEDELGITPDQPEQAGSFLDSMRDNMNERRTAPGSVPSVSGRSPWTKGPVLPSDSPWNKGPIETGRAAWNAGPAQPSGAPWHGGGSGQQPAAPWNAAPGQQPGGPGGSFLGTAAAAAAGAIGGSLLTNGIRGLFGAEQGKAQAALDPAAGAATPGSVNPSGGGNLAREAGLDDIGGSNRLASYDNSSEPQRAALFDTSQYSVEGDEGMDGDDFDSDFGGGDDTA